MKITKWRRGTVTESGLYDIPQRVYHSTDLVPGLSQSAAKVLLEDGGPARFHAALTHPQTEKAEWDLGTTVHALLLGKGTERIHVLEFPDYRTKAAQETRDAAYADGLTPMLVHQWNKAVEIADAVPDDIRAMLTDGHPEVTAIATDPTTNIPLRGQLDYLRDDAIIDVKTTNDASEWVFSRSVAKYRYHMQAAWYRRLIHTITGRELPVFIIAIETTHPYLARVYELSDDYLAAGTADMNRALDLYAECTKTGQWPGYNTTPTVLHPPAWLLRDNAADTIAALEAMIGDTND